MDSTETLNWKQTPGVGDVRSGPRILKYLRRHTCLVPKSASISQLSLAVPGQVPHKTFKPPHDRSVFGPEGQSSPRQSFFLHQATGLE